MDVSLRIGTLGMTTSSTPQPFVPVGSHQRNDCFWASCVCFLATALGIWDFSLEHFIREVEEHRQESDSKPFGTNQQDVQEAISSALDLIAKAR